MTTSFASRLSRAPLAADPARGEEAWAALSAAAPVAPELRDLIVGAAGSAPYIAGLIRNQADWLVHALTLDPDAALADALQPARDAAIAPAADRSRLLRTAKKRTALYAALADLGGVWSLEQTTGALSDLSDIATDSALRALVADAKARGRLPEAAGDTGGIVAIAMGKGGARELNYSSDIDLIFLFDESRYDPDDYLEVRSRLVRICQDATKLLSTNTEDGYVFRVDLRLRPDPSSTPICLAMETAERYYESLGRTWERAAFIKARAASGDIAAGEAFLARLRPFIWRRHLDFAAIGDAHDIRIRIRAHRGEAMAIHVPGHDIKLGRGGIREIEFFVQTRQLICGGRDPSLRQRGTRGALAALTAKGWVTPEVSAALDAAYLAHRELEHRLQMVEDAQTHRMPKPNEARARIALLSGRPDQLAFEGEIDARLHTVARLAETFFAPGGRDGVAAPATRPTDQAALAALGFTRAEAGEKLIARWRIGAIPATRSERARRILDRLMAPLLDCLSNALSPDDALSEFDRFLSGLPAGIQILSLFEANPALLDLITEICAAAPRLAAHLGRNSRVMDALLSPDFYAPLPGVDALAADLSAWLARDDDYERKLDAARRWAKEFSFRLGVQVLRGVADADEAGPGFTALAEATLRALFPVVEAEFARRHGPAPGRGACVLAMGKMGSAEMTATSDLDIIILYDAMGEEASDGPRSLTSGAWFARFTQSLIAALTAPTAEGAVWSIDTRLRPSGRQGTVASPLEGFIAYQRAKAWTWEHLALTRGRAVVGRADLMADVNAAVADVIGAPRDAAATMRDTAEMRGRIADAGRAKRGDPWSLKSVEGGLMDIEFVAQAGLLRRGRAELDRPRAPGPALALLADEGAISPEDAAVLADAHRLQLRIQQVGRIAMDGEPHPGRIGPGLAAVLARVAEADDLAGVEAALTAAQTAAAEIVNRLLPASGPASGPVSGPASGPAPETPA
jgi:glutamate-ammonia-ligase adenylyltransferase